MWILIQNMLNTNKDEWEFLKPKRLSELLYPGEGFFMHPFLKEKKNPD